MKKKTKKELEKLTYASALAVLGGFLILGLTPHPAHGIFWRWPFGSMQTESHTAEHHLLEVEEHSANMKSVVPVDPTNSRFVPVLMYHHVSDMTEQQRQKDPMRSDLTVSVSDFESQVKYFHDLGYQAITIQKLYDSLASNSAMSKAVVFTFDDGYADVFANAVPILQKNGYTGTFAISTDLLGRPDYASWDDVERADKSGMEIISHTENHLDLTDLQYSEDDLKREIFASKTLLEVNLGHKVEFFVYPYGHTNLHVEELVQDAGYKMAFTTNFGLWIGKDNLLSEPRLRVHGVDGLEKIRKVLPD
jgi:peptidoglycan/xylan/chitin deacetylase (PgdA/CDA1 family)